MSSARAVIGLELCREYAVNVLSLCAECIAIVLLLCHDCAVNVPLLHRLCRSCAVSVLLLYRDYVVIELLLCCRSLPSSRQRNTPDWDGARPVGSRSRGAQCAGYLIQ